VLQVEVGVWVGLGSIRVTDFRCCNSSSRARMLKSNSMQVNSCRDSSHTCEGYLSVYKGGIGLSHCSLKPIINFIT